MVDNNCSQFISGLKHWINIDSFSTCSNGEAISNYWRGVVDSNSFHFMPLQYPSIASNCYVTFREATSNGDDGFPAGTILASSRVTIKLSGCKD